MSTKREPKPTWDPEYIRDISELVYRARLESDCLGNVQRMIAKDEDTGEKLRNRAGQYDAITRIYLGVLGFEPAATEGRITSGADQLGTAAIVPNQQDDGSKG